jgi:hypothetical protein
MLPVGSPPGGWDSLARIAREAEAAGWDRIVVGDHVVMHERDGDYPWGGEYPYPPETPWPEPLTLLTWLSAHTTTIRLMTGILITPLRPAALAAKTVATADVLSGGRIDLGVGPGWNVAEYPGQPGPQAGDPSAERAVKDDGDDVGVVPEVEQFVVDVAVIRVDGHQPGLERAEDRLQVFGPVVEVLGDLVLVPATACDEEAGESFGPPLEVGPGQAALTVDQCPALRQDVGGNLPNVGDVPAAHEKGQVRFAKRTT